MQSPIETEVKIQLPSPHSFPARLLALGFPEHKPRIFEANTLFDTSANTLRQGSMLLRLRQAGSKGVITWKGKAVEGLHKSRPEMETEIGSVETLGSILQHIGFAPVFRYEKYRTEFQNDPAGIVTFDETPIGDFLELEGEAAWIDRTALQLGFSPADYVLESYGKLYQLHCAEREISASNMTFTAHP